MIFNILNIRLEYHQIIQKEVKKRKRTYKFSLPTKTIDDGWCHQCKMKKPRLLVCVNFWKRNTEKKCGGKYCTKCIEKHYEENINDLISLKKWYCYSCTQKCKCLTCKRDRLQKRVQNQKFSCK
eukprot:TRINITY_DN17852_c0_g1_i1.p1 TRINITY_DN17852_c0_g1~~TRINITY_DN17852_c0_g1_i1.p1  ORF type:complete len:124 (+),score=8.39 TRINITY_DN17852_c0_g1_i1:232-603(+)